MEHWEQQHDSRVCYKITCLCAVGPAATFLLCAPSGNWEYFTLLSIFLKNSATLFRKGNQETQATFG